MRYVVYIEFLVDRCQDYVLDEHHAVHDRAVVKEANHGHFNGWGQLGIVSEPLKSQGLQGVTGEDSGGFVKGDVAAGFSPTQIVVVHGRQIVVPLRLSAYTLPAWPTTIRRPWPANRRGPGCKRVRTQPQRPEYRGRAHRLHPRRRQWRKLGSDGFVCRR